MTRAKIISTSFFSGVVVALVSLLITFIFFPLKYGATARVLVAPHAIAGVDPYTSSKAAERVAQNVAEVIPTSQFFNRVVSVPVGIEVNYFPQDELQRRKMWGKTIDASVAYNTGILQIVAYHPNPDQAVRLATAVTNVLASSGNDFAVNASDFKTIDTPVASRYPVQPNVAAIAVIAFLGGAFVSGLYLRRRF